MLRRWIVCSRIDHGPFMGTTTKISVEEYLHTAYRPDVEYVDGEIQERNVGEIEHARMIKAVLKWFMQHEMEWRVEALSDVRVQVSPDRFRIPAICVSAKPAPTAKSS